MQDFKEFWRRTMLLEHSDSIDWAVISRAGIPKNDVVDGILPRREGDRDGSLDVFKREGDKDGPLDVCKVCDWTGGDTDVKPRAAASG